MSGNRSGTTTVNGSVSVRGTLPQSAACEAIGKQVKMEGGGRNIVGRGRNGGMSSWGGW